MAARPVWPPRGGSELRISGLIEQARRRGHTVLLVQPDPADPADVPEGVATTIARRTWTGSGKAVGKLLSPLPLHSPRIGRDTVTQVRQAVVAFAPEVLVVSETHAWPLADGISDVAPIVFDAHNVETRLVDGMRSVARGAQRVAFTIDLGRTDRLERRILGRAAVTVAVSDEDAAALRLMAPGARILTARSSVPLPDVAVDPASAPPVILFIGQLDFPPNTNAVLTLLDEVLPAVRAEVPEAALHVVGRRPPAQLRDRVEATDGASLFVDVPDLEPFYAGARLTAMPIATGSGSRLKVLEAMAHGLPMVASRVAVEGNPVTAGQDVVLADDSPTIVAGIIDLLRDPSAAGALGARARETFVHELGWERSGDQLERALELALAPDGGQP